MTRLRFILGGLTLCVTCLQPHTVRSQPWMSPLEVARAGVGIALPQATHGPNPASRGQPVVRIGVLREFALPELTSATLLVGRPSLSLATRHLAFSGYAESAFALSGTLVLSGWRIGARLRETWVRPAGFRNRWESRLTVGVLRSFSRSSVGVALTREGLGLGWSAERGPWRVALDVETTPSGLAPGLAWQFGASEAVSIDGGVSGNPSKLGFGAEVGIGRWGLSIGLQRHIFLGWSSGLAIGWG